MFIQEYLRGLQQNTLSNTTKSQRFTSATNGITVAAFFKTRNAINLLESASVLACTPTSDVLLEFKVTLL